MFASVFHAGLCLSNSLFLSIHFRRKVEFYIYRPRKSLLRFFPGVGKKLIVVKMVIVYCDFLAGCIGGMI